MEFDYLDKNAVLQCKELTKTYFQGDLHIHAVKDVFLRVQPGEFIAITGTSGSGKSTLLHLLSGLDRPTSGKVYIDGIDINSLRDKDISDFRNQKIGFIFQNFNLLPVLTAKENILISRLIGQRPRDDDYFNELVSLLNIDDRLHHLPSELSGGQQQRVAIARALINMPQVVFADEPTGNLDRANADEVLELLLTIKAQIGQTLVMVTHDMAIAERADRIYRMENGELEPYR